MDVEIILCYISVSILVVFIIFLLRPIKDLSFKAISLTPSEMKWFDHVSTYHNGIKISDLVGNLKKPEPYSRRIILPANMVENPHYHLDRARTITIISGTLYYAYGDRYDESKLKAFPAGSFITEPRKIPHFVVTKKEGVILQVSGIGPSKTVYLDNKRRG